MIWWNWENPGIYDSTGDKVVEYTYSAWGEVLSVTGSMATTIGQINPIRYRGYYYDTETGYYYLQSRYYDPETHRFLNADGYISTSQGILGYNMFAYCGNNPINTVDPSGQFWGAAVLGSILKAVVTALVITICVVVIAQPIIQKSTITGTLGGITGNSIIGNQRSKVETKPSDKTKSKDIAPAIPKAKETQTQTYYHVTTPENAASIKATGIMTGSAWEGNFVYAWKLKPNKMAIENSGAHFGVVFSFKTNATFTIDPGIENPEVLKYGPVVSTSPGPIVVWDVQIVEVMK